MKETELLIKRNKQGHKVCRLHYTADPDKNEKWVEKEANKLLGGTSSLLWRREYLIDFSAGSGELVFPWLPDIEKEIFIDPFTIGPEYNIFGGFDFGTRNPNCFSVFVESPDGYLYGVWEYYAERVSIPQLAKEIKSCPFYERIQWISADPMIFTENLPKKDGFTSVAGMLQDEDEVGEEFIIDKLSPAHDRSDVACIEKLKSFWGVTPPKLRIFKNCVNGISEIRNLKYPERKENVNEAEKILDKNNHYWDSMKYVILSHPYSTTVEEKHKFGTYGYLNEIADMAEQIASRTGQATEEVFRELWGRNL